MKKILSMLLTVVMLFGLFTVPAAAEEIPVYEQFGFASQEEFMDFRFYYPQKYGMTYEEVCVILLAEYEKVLANPQIALDYWGITAEELEVEIANDWWIDYEDFCRYVTLCMVDEMLGDYVPPVSVQLDGEKVIFPDAAPEITDGRTMVPFRAIAEEMGFTVSFDNGAIVGSDGETSVAFTVGETACMVSKEAGTETVTMDTAPYIKEDRTYVPVRFFAEAMGMTVAWDEDYRVAVIYDKEAWIEKMNEDFTIYNSLLKMNPEAQEVPEDFEMMLSMGMTVTEISSLDGNTSYPVNFDVTFIKEGNEMQANMLLDIFEIYKLSMEETGFGEEYMEAALKGMEAYLKDISADLIINLDEGTLYFHCPALNYYLATQGVLSISDAGSTWFSSDELPAVDMEEVTAGLEELLGSIPTVESVGDIIMYLQAPEDNVWPSKGLEEMMEVEKIVAMILGDAVFAQKGNEYTATWDYTMDELAPEDAYIEGGYFKGKMSFDMKAQEIDLDAEVRVNDSYDGDTLVKVEIFADNQDVTMKMMVHEENETIIEFEIDGKVNDAKKSPLSAPPKGAVIMDMDEIEL